VKARWFDEQNTGRGGIAAATYQKRATVSHAAVNKPVTITVTAKLDDPEKAAKLLVDGVLGRAGSWGAPEVLRLGSSDLEAVIDMGAKTQIHKVAVRCIYCQEAGIYPARSVAVFVSDDGRTFTAAGAAEFKVPDARGADGTSVTEIPIESTAAGRYVKVFCKNNGPLPAWHNSPGVLGHLMLDEILVNPGVKE
jgi:hexosaminidase